MPIDTIPFVLAPSQRDTGTGDERLVSVLVEAQKNMVSQSQRVYVRKRWGFTEHIDPVGGLATGRGIYAWTATGKIYSVFGDKIYSNTTDLGVSLAASSGRCWFAQTPATAAEQLLLISDGSDLYRITTSDTIDQIDETDDAQFPTPNNGPIDYVDGYVVMTTSNYLVNSELNSTTSWLAADIKPMDRGADIVAHVVQKDQIMLFGKKNIDFLFNVGKPIGSPFQRIEQNALGFGLAAKNSLAWSGDICFFVGENPGGGDGARSIWMIAGLKTVKDIGNPVINRFLSAEGTSISTCLAACERIDGQLLYILTLDSANRTFVYSVDTDMWVEWSASGTTQFATPSMTSINGSVYFQAGNGGVIYQLSPTVYVDETNPTPITIQTEPRDQGTSNRKSVQYVELVADTQSTGMAALEASDDDYQTWGTVGIFDMTQDRKRVHRVGSYKGSRAWRLTHRENTPFRAQALRLAYEVGSH